MAFKSDWSFLDKITMGAAGTKKVIELLTEEGHQIIELERYSTSNKIWSTKIKRLRIPDLLCLTCGRRIESRAKSKLGIIMSDSSNNPDRRWFVGLRENDIVAFITCYRDAYNNWVAGDTVNLFCVQDMMETESASVLGPPKSQFEGSERDRTWKTAVPSFDFTVLESPEDEVSYKLLLQKPDGKLIRRELKKPFYLYVYDGQSYKANEKMIGGIVPRNHSCKCSGVQYDFFQDIQSPDIETKYAAVKALGYLERTPFSTAALSQVAKDNNTDYRVRLEAYASLIRLGLNALDEMKSFVLSTEQIDMQMEYVLILGELAPLYPNRMTRALIDVIQNATHEEMVAAAIWSLPDNPNSLHAAIEHCFSDSEVIRRHAIAKIEKSFSASLTVPILDHIGENDSINAICAHILTNSPDVDYRAVVRRYDFLQDGHAKSWLLFIMGLSNEDEYRRSITECAHDPNAIITSLDVLWKCYPHSISSVESDSIAFIKQQN